MSDLIKLLATERDRMFQECREGFPRTYTTWTPELLHLAADWIEALTAEVQRLDYSTTHTCWDECPRLACAQRREIEALTAELARARQEGWNAAIEAARNIMRKPYAWDALEALTRSGPPANPSDADPVRDTKADSDGGDGA